MSCGCHPSNFYISPPMINTASIVSIINNNSQVIENIVTEQILNIFSSATVQQQITNTVTTITNQILSQTPFSIVLQPGLQGFQNKPGQYTGFYFAEQIGQSIISPNTYSFVWKEDLFDIFTKGELIFWTTEGNDTEGSSYSDVGGLPLDTPIEVRLIQSNSTYGVDYTFFENALNNGFGVSVSGPSVGTTGTTGGLSNYQFQGEWNASNGTLQTAFVEQLFSPFPEPPAPNSGMASSDGDVGKTWIVTTSSVATVLGNTWSVGDLLVLTAATINGYTKIPLANIPFVKPGSVILQTTITTSGIHAIPFDFVPTTDSIVYLTSRIIVPYDPLVTDYVFTATLLYGARVDLFFSGTI